MNFFEKSRSGGVIRQIVSFGAGEGVARGLNWSMMALLPLFLSTEEYGRVGLLVSIELLVSNISLMGLDRVVLRFYDKDEAPGKLLKSVLAIWAAFAWVPLAVVLGLYLSGWETLFGIPLAPHLFLLSGIVAIFNLNFLCICIGRAKRHLAFFLRFRLCYVAIKFVCVLTLARMIGHSLSYVVGFGVSALVMLIFIIPFLRERAEGRAERAVVGRLLIFGWPFVFHMINDNVLSYFSRFFIEVYGSTKDVGIFTFAFTLGNSLFIVYAVLAAYFEPRIYSHADDKPRCEKWLAFYTNACIALGSVVGASLLFLYPYLTPRLPADYGAALPTISMVMGTALLRPLYLQGNYRLTANSKTGHIAAASFLGACLSTALNFLLIPTYGIWGAAVGLFAASALVCAYILVASLRIAHIPLRQQSSLPTYVIGTLGSLSVIVWAHRPGVAIIALLVVCLATSALLLRSLMTLGEHTK